MSASLFPFWFMYTPSVGEAFNSCLYKLQILFCLALKLSYCSSAHQICSAPRWQCVYADVSPRQGAVVVCWMSLQGVIHRPEETHLPPTEAEPEGGGYCRRKDWGGGSNRKASTSSSLPHWCVSGIHLPAGLDISTHFPSANIVDFIAKFTTYSSKFCLGYIFDLLWISPHLGLQPMFAVIKHLIRFVHGHTFGIGLWTEMKYSIYSYFWVCSRWKLACVVTFKYVDLVQLTDS